MSCKFPQESQATFLIPGPAGQIEVMTTWPSVEIVPKTVAVICHPHPLYEGTMHNKVVYTIARAFAQLQVPTVRFNFRGIGKSSGAYGATVGEIEDLQAVLTWVQESLDVAFYLAGFSFGSYIATSVAINNINSLSLQGLITVAPPVNHFPFHKIQRFSHPWLVVQGELDDVVPATEVYQWIATRHEKIELVKFTAVDHFFHGKLIELRESILSFLQRIEAN